MKNVLLLDHQAGAWESFLREFFEDTASAFHPVHDSSKAGTKLSQNAHDIAFVNPELLSIPLVQKLKALRDSNANFRIFGVGERAEKDRQLSWDARFGNVSSLADFQKRIVAFLPLPENIRVLIADDEIDIGNMVCEFLEGRSKPSFQVTHVEDGQKALDHLAKEIPDVLILDIKMPFRTGCEVYREVRRNQWKVPVIIFFDAISGEEIKEINLIGNPAIVDKGSHQSSMPQMAALIKKMAYFG